MSWNVIWEWNHDAPEESKFTLVGPDAPEESEFPLVGPHSPWDTTPLITVAGTTGCNVSAPTASVHRPVRLHGVCTVPTFRSGAQYPLARIAHDLGIGDYILWQYYCKHETYVGAYVYIEPNVCDDPFALAFDAYYKADIRWPTFMSVDQYPWARIEYTRDVDNSLDLYYRKHGAYDGAIVYITPNDDNKPVDVILNHWGSLVMMQFRP